MGNQLWIRKYKILVANKDGKAWDTSDLRCVFRIEKVARRESNLSVVDIYNLNRDTDFNILKEGSRIIVEAGYDGFEDTKDAKGAPTKTPSQYGKIYDGDIVQVIRSHENNVDYMLRIVSLDGENELNKGWIMESLPAGSTPRKVIDTIAEKSNYKFQIGRISDNLDKAALPRGKVLFGQPRDYLQDISYNNNGTFYVEDGLLYVTKCTDIPPGEVLELTPQTGLIGYPRQVEAGIEFKCLLNPKIRSECMVKIDNDSIIPMQVTHRGQQIPKADSSSEYQVIRHTHTGDTRGQEWYTSCIAVGRLGKGFIPTLLENDKQNPYGPGG